MKQSPGKVKKAAQVKEALVGVSIPVKQWDREGRNVVPDVSIGFPHLVSVGIESKDIGLDVGKKTVLRPRIGISPLGPHLGVSIGKREPGKVKEAAGFMGGGVGSIGTPSMSEQYYMSGMGETGDDENMPLELVSMAGPRAAQGAQMVQMAKRLAKRPTKRAVQRHLAREGDKARIIQGLEEDLRRLNMEDAGPKKPGLLGKLMGKHGSAKNPSPEEVRSRHVLRGMDVGATTGLLGGMVGGGLLGNAVTKHKLGPALGTSLGAITGFYGGGRLGIELGKRRAEKELTKKAREDNEYLDEALFDLEKGAEEQGIWLYHGSPRENEQSIDKEGIRPGADTKRFMLARQLGRFAGRTGEQDASVHLADNPLYAGMYGQSDKKTKRLMPDRSPLVYAVKVKPSEVRLKGNEWADLKVPAGKARIKGEVLLFKGRIPPDRIQKIEMPSVIAVVNDRFAQAKNGPMAKKAYKLQGHTDFQGIPIAIENRPGSIRKGTDRDGKKWETKMKLPYGYIKGTKGADEEEVDTFVGPKKDAPIAFVVHQHNDDGKGYDEDKVMLGFDSKKRAKEAYLAHYDDPKYLGPIARVSTERLKELVATKKKLVKISQVSYKAMLDELMSKEAYELSAWDKRQITNNNARRYANIGAFIGSAAGLGLGALTSNRLFNNKGIATSALLGSTVGSMAGAAKGYMYGKTKGREKWRALEQLPGVDE